MNFLDRKSGRYSGGKRRVPLSPPQKELEDRLEWLKRRTVVCLIDGIDPTRLSVRIHPDPVPNANLGKPGVGSLVSIDRLKSEVSIAGQSCGIVFLEIRPKSDYNHPSTVDSDDSMFKTVHLKEQP